MNTEIRSYMESIKAGDTVSVTRNNGSVRDVVVTKVTSTQIVCGENRYYRTNNSLYKVGTMVGGDWRSSWVCTPEKAESLRAAAAELAARGIAQRKLEAAIALIPNNATAAEIDTITAAINAVIGGAQ